MERITKLTGVLSPLLEIPDPPTQLYIEGDLPILDSKILAVVGSRRLTSYGRDVCYKLISGLAGYPISIISGLAIGMDTLAHKAALEAGLHTMSFPGSGLSRKVLHPHSNRGLAEEILESGGALVSEFDPEYPAGVHTFPRRNRIMAGVAHACLVIEAGIKSGTRITARLATEYNKDVLAVPGSIFSPQSEGTNELIRLGATPVTKPEDILLALGFEVDGESSKQRELNLDDLSKNERLLVEILSLEPLVRDDLIRESGLPVNEANIGLASLEIKGIIVESMGEVRLN